MQLAVMFGYEGKNLTVKLRFKMKIMSEEVPFTPSLTEIETFPPENLNN